MPCQRCHGLMIVDYFLDLQDMREHLWLRAWRCVNCGDVVEPTIMRRRMARRSRLGRLIDRLAERAQMPSEVIHLGI